MMNAKLLELHTYILWVTPIAALPYPIHLALCRNVTYLKFVQRGPQHDSQSLPPTTLTYEKPLQLRACDSGPRLRRTAWLYIYQSDLRTSAPAGGRRLSASKRRGWQPADGTAAILVLLDARHQRPS